MSFLGIFASWMLAAAAEPPLVQDPRAANLQFIGMLLFTVVIMYILFFRPQQKKAKEHAELLKILRTGDKVVTSGGIVGVVTSVKDKSVLVRTGDNAKLEILKSAVSEVTEKAGADKAAAPAPAS